MSKQFDFKTAVEPLVIKPIMNPLELPEVTEVTAEHVQWLHEWASVRVSVRASVWAYISSFYTIEYREDFSSAVKLWEDGLVPSYDGQVWRLHTGKDAHVVYEDSAK